MQNSWNKSSHILHAQLGVRLIGALLCVLLGVLLMSCQTRSEKNFSGKGRGKGGSSLSSLEKSYLRGEFAKAYAEILPRLKSAKSKDKVLLLLQMGNILYSMQDWEASARVFEEALALSDVATQSLSENARAFFLNDTTKRYIPENFERILIFYYLSINHIMLENQLRAYQYLKRMSDELSTIRDFDAQYKENYAARYLYGLVAESLGRYEEARVQYNNLIRVSEKTNIQAIGEASLYWLALSEGDERDISKYQNRKELLSQYHPLSPEPSGASDDLIRDENLENDETITTTATKPFYLPSEELGSLVVVHENGLAPFKESRGKIGKDVSFKGNLTIGIPIVLGAGGFAALSYGQLFFWIADSENPIPRFKAREPYISRKPIPLTINAHHSFLPTLADSHSEVVLRNFNDNYETYVKRHTTSIITKVATVAVSSAVISAGVKKGTGSEGVGALFGFLANAIGGAVVKSTLKPDLRSWTLAFDNLQIYRVFLPPGQYTLALDSHEKNQPNKNSFFALSADEIEIKTGETIFVRAISF